MMSFIIAGLLFSDLLSNSGTQRGMSFVLYYQPRYENDFLNHKRNMIAIYDSEFVYLNCILSARYFDEHPKYTL